MIGPFESVLLRTLLTPLVATLQLFAVYVVVHGHYSPGGGFQGGALLGASLILPLLSKGRVHGLFLLSERGAGVAATCGILIFAALGIAPMMAGFSMLDYGETAGQRSLGILGIEVGVTLAVAGAVVSIFYSLYAEDEEEIP